MGDFNYTCAISGLPIGGGDNVRLLLLQSSPFSDRGNYANGELSWYIRALPVRGEYSSYGSVNELDPADVAIQQNWLEGLKVDLREKGWGNNTAHDVPTKKGMSFDELLSALGEARLAVRPELRTAKENREYHAWLDKHIKSRTKRAKGIPTMRRIERIIAKAGTITYSVTPDHVIKSAGGQRYVYTPPKEEKNYSPTYDPHVGFDCGIKIDDTEGTGAEVWRLDISQLGNEDHRFIVDELRRGEIRVRVGGYGSGPEHLLRLNGLVKKLRRRFAVMISPGEFGHGQLLIHPHPETSDGESYFSFHDRPGEVKKPKTCHLAQAMVREDVWQALCGMSSEFWDKKYKTIKGTLDVYRKLAREAWDAYRKEYVPKPPEPGEEETAALLRRMHRGDWKSWAHDTHNPVGWFTGDNPSITGFGMDTSWKLFACRTDLTEPEIENWLDVVAQTTLINSMLGTIRIQLRPVGSHGPQYGEWGEHKTYLKKILRIASRKAFQDVIRRAEDRGWQRRWKQEQEEKKAKPAEGSS